MSKLWFVSFVTAFAPTALAGKVVHLWRRKKEEEFHRKSTKKRRKGKSALLRPWTIPEPDLGKPYISIAQEDDKKSNLYNSGG